MESNQLTTQKNITLKNVETNGCEGLDTSDLLISRLQLQQPLSQLVAQGKSLPGEIVDSVSGEVLAKKGAVLEVIPVASFKEWHVLHLVNNAWEFKGKIPFGIENANWLKEDIIDGIQVRRDLAINFFVLLKGKEKEFPYLLSLKRSSYYAGRKISTAIQKNMMLNTKIYSSVFEIKSTLQTFEKFTFFAFDAEKKNDSTEEQMGEAKIWNERLSKAKTKVEIHEDSEEVPF